MVVRRCSEISLRKKIVSGAKMIATETTADLKAPYQVHLIVLGTLIGEKERRLPFRNSVLKSSCKV